MSNPVVPAIIFTVSLIAIIYGISVIDRFYSKRERGIKREKRRKIGRKK